MSKVVQALQQELETMYQADSFSHFRGLVTPGLAEKGIADVSARLARLMRKDVSEAHRREFIEARQAHLIKRREIGRVWIYHLHALLDEHIWSAENPFAEDMRESSLSMGDGTFGGSDLMKYLSLVDVSSLEGYDRTHARKVVEERFWSAVRDMIVWMVACSGEHSTCFLQLFDVSDLIHTIKGQHGPIDSLLDGLHEHPNTVDLIGSFCVQEYLEGNRLLGDTWRGLTF